MSTVGIILAVMYVIQLAALPAAILGDAMMCDKEWRMINSKRDVFNFLIPFIWVPTLIRAVYRWWKALK